MSRFRKSFVAVWMMAFWLFATQHCGLEAAGLLDSHAEALTTCCEGGESHCTHDGCEVVEGRGFIASSAVKLNAPPLAICHDFVYTTVVAPLFDPGPPISPEHFTRTLDWVPVWQFVQRAAPSPRAPSELLA